MSLTPEDVNKRFSFETYLKVQFHNMVFLSLLDAATLEELGQDPRAEHAQIYPSLPPGAPQSYRDYLYAKFENLQGQRIYMGIPWINPTTLVEVGSNVATITIRNYTQEQLDTIRSMLPGLGITDFEYSVK